MQAEESLAPATLGAPRDKDQNEDGGPHQGLHRVLHKASYYIAALTEGIARIQYLPRVLHETRGQALLAPRAFSREQWSRL